MAFHHVIVSASGSGGLDINSLTVDATPDGAADYVATYDASAGVNKKVLINNLGGASSYSFTIAQPDNGTSPTADSATDTLTYTSSDASITITGNSTTDTLDFVSAGGTGDVVGPASATNNAIARFDGTTGKLIQDYTSGAPLVTDGGALQLADGNSTNPAVGFSGATNTGLYKTGTSIRFVHSGGNSLLINNDSVRSAWVLGPGQYATGSLPTASSWGGYIAYDTTTSTMKFSDGATWADIGGGGSGDVVGPASSADNEIPRHDSTTGKLLQSYTSSPPVISDTGQISSPDASHSLSERFGAGTTISGANSMALGNASSAGLNATGIGYAGNAGASYATAFGAVSAGNASGATSIGYVSSGNQTNSTAIGSSSNCTGGYSVAIGFNCSVSATNSVAIGASASAGTNEVMIGGNASATGTASTCIGVNSASTASEGTCVGYSASVAGEATGMGHNVTASGAYSACFGAESTVSATGSVVVGAYSNATHSGCIVLGRTGSTTATNQLILGTTNTDIRDVYIGRGPTNTTTATVTLSNTSAEGTDIAGSDFIIHPSRGTGTGVSGDLIFKVAPATTTGTALGTLATVMTLKAEEVSTTKVFSPGQFATGSLPTASSYEGFIAYDTTTQTMKWSNGTAWATI